MRAARFRGCARRKPSIDRQPPSRTRTGPGTQRSSDCDQWWAHKMSRAEPSPLSCRRPYPLRVLRSRLRLSRHRALPTDHRNERRSACRDCEPYQQPLLSLQSYTSGFRRRPGHCRSNRTSLPSPLRQLSVPALLAQPHQRRWLALYPAQQSRFVMPAKRRAIRSLRQTFADLSWLRCLSAHALRCRCNPQRAGCARWSLPPPAFCEGFLVRGTCSLPAPLHRVETTAGCPAPGPNNKSYEYAHR